MKKLFFISIVLFSQGFQKLLAQEDFTWHVNIDTVIVSQTGLIVGSDQDKFEDFVNLGFSLDLFYQGLFINSDNENRVDFLANTEIGYELLVRDSYTLDLLFVTSYFQGFDSLNAGRVTNRKINELDGIRKRKNDASQALRFSKYLQNSVFWIDIGADLLADYHDGYVIDSQYIYNLEMRNWDIRFGVGATYFSKDMASYYASVSEEEETITRPSYDASSGYRFRIDTTAVKAISQNALFRAGLRLESYSSAFSLSPLYEDDKQIIAWAGVRYVW